MKQFAGKLWGTLKQSIKRPLGIFCTVAWFVLVILSAVFSTFFYNDYNTTVGYVEENFSNPILQDAPLRVYFTSTGKLKEIQLRFVAKEEDAYAHTLEFMLYTDGGYELLYAQTLDPTSIDMGAIYSVQLPDYVNKGTSCYIELRSNVTDAGEAYYITMGAAASTDVTAWYWGEQQEPDVPDISLVYHRFGRTYFGLYFLCMLVLLVVLLVPRPKNKKLRVAANLAVPLGCAVFVAYITELLSVANLEHIMPQAFLANVLLFLCVYALLFALTNRLGVALAISNTLLLLGAVVNHYVLAFRGTTITPTDLYGVGTAMGVLDGYTLFVSREVLLVVAFWAAMLAAGLWDNAKIPKRRARLAFAGITLVCVGAFGKFVADEGIHQGAGLYIDRYRQTTASRKNGFYLNFALNVPDMFNAKPRGYTTDAVQGLAGPTAATSDVQPDIIFIMNESLTDFTVTGAETQLSEDPLGFIRSVGEDDAGYYGYVVVPTYGGGTSMTEFEALTGFSLALENMSYSPFYQYVHSGTPSLGQSLSELGYHTIGMHPESEKNWNRDVAYPLLGFSESYFIADFEGAEALRSMVSDRALYTKATELMQKGDSPTFLFAVTMQNHGGYTVPGFETDIVVGGEKGADPSAEQYFTLAKESDRAFEELIEHYSTVEKPTIIVMFGDHWPQLEEYTLGLIGEAPEDISGEASITAYTTPLVMWSNYGVDFSFMEDMGSVSTNYLGSLIKRAAGLPLTGFDSFMLEMVREYPVISTHGILSADGVHYDNESYAEVADILRNYGYVVYNGMLDSKNRRHEFFQYS